ncbi:hypothetical protein N7505_011914 [Penicillium chrysogenum]|uniref:Uncharacterized protein n=1 Tax=Penicillium chrysogenum TaxID=5076 RepID=A0ABQ8VZU5_PENCH|nr:hypothetical protein N7505_011914 [Penicillium chrysogenum]
MSGMGFFGADNILEFAEAAEAIAKHADLHGPRFVIEEYCDGPEVNANLVLSEGEILFSQVCDEQPKLGDGTLEEKALGFTESGVMWYSNLPSSEQNLIVQDLHQKLLRLGLHSGVLHLRPVSKSH